jgi:uncharacterized protein
MDLMAYLIVPLVALVGSLLSFMSGFGLGTLLLPAFMLFFPVEIAVLATAVVHMVNNLFKLGLVGKFANYRMIVRFGITSIIGAALGAWCMQMLPTQVLCSYNWLGHQWDIVGNKLVFSAIILFFAFYELRDEGNKRNIAAAWLPVGGLISGFFGGLSGHQGALRSAFLMRTDLNKEEFMGTRVVLACLVDVTRISIYAGMLSSTSGSVNYYLVTVASLAAFIGAFYGKKWMLKADTTFINRFIAISMILFATAMAAGLI